MGSLDTKAAGWRADTAPGELALMDQCVAARIADLKKQGVTVKTGRTVGAGSFDSLCRVSAAVTRDLRTDPESATYAAFIEATYAEGNLAAHMMGTYDFLDEPVTRIVRERGPQWPAMAAGMAAGVLAMLGLAWQVDVSRVEPLPAQPAAVAPVLEPDPGGPAPGSEGEPAPGASAEPSLPAPIQAYTPPPVDPPPVPAPGPTRGVDPEPQVPVEVEAGAGISDAAVSASEAAVDYVASADGEGAGLVSRLVRVVGGLL